MYAKQCPGEYVRRQLLMKMVDYVIGQTRLASWKSTSLEMRERERERA